MTPLRLDLDAIINRRVLLGAGWSFLFLGLANTVLPLATGEAAFKFLGFIPQYVIGVANLFIAWVLLPPLYGYGRYAVTPALVEFVYEPVLGDHNRPPAFTVHRKITFDPRRVINVRPDPQKQCWTALTLSSGESFTVTDGYDNVLAKLTGKRK